MSRTKSWIMLAGLAVGAAALPARAADLDNDDLTGEAVIEALSWEPIITMMRITHEGDGDEALPAAPKPLQSLPTLTAAWRQLQPLIGILGPDDPPREQFVSGWHTLYGDKIEIRAHVFPQQKLQQMFDAPPKRFLIRHDILTNLPPSRKQEALRRSFEIKRWTLSLHKVAEHGDDPKMLTRPASNIPDDRQQFPVMIRNDDALPLSNDSHLLDFNELGCAPKVDPGIWEIRSVMTMRGRLDPEGPYGPDRTVQGCIRFQVLQKGFEVRRVGYESSGFSRSVGGPAATPKKAP